MDLFADAQTAENHLHRGPSGHETGVASVNGVRMLRTPGPTRERPAKIPWEMDGKASGGQSQLFTTKARTLSGAGVPRRP
jgi:hypothetical protein